MESLIAQEKKSWVLAIRHDEWSEAIRRLISGESRFEVAQLRWNITRLSVELIAGAFSSALTAPAGSELGSAVDSLVLSLQTELTTSQLAPQALQTLVTLHINRSLPSVGWRGEVFHRGQTYPLDEVLVIGPGMLRLARNSLVQPDNEGIGNDRWSRTAAAIGPAVLQKVQQARVTLIGAGRTGSQFALQVSSLGIRRLRIVDPDQLEMWNLDAMPGIDPKFVSDHKVAAVVDAVQESRPDMDVYGFPISVTSHQAQQLLLERADLIVSCVDSQAARLATSIAAQRTMTPHLDIGTSVQRPEGVQTISADVRLLLPGQGCVACVGGDADLGNTMRELTSMPGSLPERLPSVWNEQRAGSLISVNSIAVGTALQIWLELVTGRIQGSFWQRIAWDAERGLICDAGRVTGSEDCKVCR